MLSILCVVFGVSAAFLHPMGIAGIDEFRNNDWLNCRSFDVLTRRALLQDGEWPLRTHLLGGGFPVAAHPSDGSWAPTLLAVLLVGDVIGVKLNLLLFLIIGTLGVHAIARRWLTLSEEASFVAAALFGVSGWLPSMWLVGFYNQVFYLLTPAVLYLLVSSARDEGGPPGGGGAADLRRLLIAGMLLCFVLQQGGHAFPAIVFFLGVVVWGMAAMESAEDGDGALRTWAPPLSVLLMGTSAMAFAKELHAGWPLLVAAVASAAILGAVPRMRRFVKALVPWGGRLAFVLVVCCSLGAARLVGLAIMESADSTYDHRLQRGEALWFPVPEDSSTEEERFYDSVPEFLRGLSGRVPAEVSYGMVWGREGDPGKAEYAWLGLTPPFVALMFLGLGLAARGPRRGQLVAGLAVIFSLICFGWRAPPDLHFLMTWGIPPLDGFSQPIKYWNFFILLTGVLLVGIAVDALPRRKLMIPVVVVLLAWPFAQNRAPLAELFRFERPADPEVEHYHQLAMVAEEWWVEQGEDRIRRMSDKLYLSDYVRPRIATEYFNLRRGVGTADHYGSIVLPDHTVPATYVTLAGQAIANPRCRREAWLSRGRGRIVTTDIGHSRIVVEVELDTASTLVINQNWLDGFSTTVGRLLPPVDGLLGVDVPAGRHRVELRYRPETLLRGFAVSAVSFVGWLVAMGAVRRRTE
jgi:hypothetical protein